MAVEVSSTEITSDVVIALGKLVRIVHHVPGRLRVRFAGGSLAAPGVGSLQDFRQFVESIPGVEGLRISPATLSAIVEYNPSVLPPGAWENLINGPEQAAQRAFQTLTARSQAG